MMNTTAAGRTDVGCKRDTNEDRILVQTDRGLFAVADGMGGEHCGELAADIALQSVSEYLQDSDASLSPESNAGLRSAPEDRLLNAMRYANAQIWEACYQRPECAGMGTTISVALMAPDSVVIGNIGDSRVYLYRNGQLQQLTRDDALVSHLLEEGKITAERAKTHPWRNVLTQALGRSREIDVHTVRVPLQPSDQLLLASDGLHAVVGDAEIGQALEAGTDPDSTAQALIDSARREGGPDNISCIVILCR